MNSPSRVGEPLTTPFLASLRPGGKRPPLIDQACSPPPDAVSLAVYGTPRVAARRMEFRIASPSRTSSVNLRCEYSGGFVLYLYEPST